jgi:hypothetical protein
VRIDSGAAWRGAAIGVQSPCYLVGRSCRPILEQPGRTMLQGRAHPASCTGWAPSVRAHKKGTHSSAAQDSISRNDTWQLTLLKGAIDVSYNFGGWW